MEILIFFLILSILVLVHEWGHFFAARVFGVRVEEFGFGLPPRALRFFVQKGTEFTLNWLPIGGFVKLFGEDYVEEDELKPHSSERFYDKPAWQRAIILTAGVIMNFILGVFLFGIVYSYLGIPTETERVRVEEVAVDSPAEKVGIRVGEVVSEFNSEVTVTSTEQLVRLINENKGKEVRLQVVNEEGGEREIKVTPRENPPEGQGSLGVLLTNTELIKYPWWQMPFRGMLVGLKEAVAWGRQIASGILQMLYGLITGKGVPGDVAGPIGIYQVSSQVSKHGLIPTLQFMGVLSVNLAILNILPLPALDGGRLVFLGIEKLIGKKRKNRIEGYVHSVGMALLLGLMVLISLRDVLRLIKIN